MTDRPRILLVTRSLPAPANVGDRQRTAHLLHALELVGSVDVLFLGCVPDEDREAVAQACHLVGAVMPEGPSARWPWRALRTLVGTRRADRIAHNIGSHGRYYTATNRPVADAIAELRAVAEYDVIVGRYLHSAALSGLLGRARVIVDVDDLPAEVYASRLRGEQPTGVKAAILRRHLEQHRVLQPRLLNDASWLWFVTPENLAISPHARVSLLPNLPSPGLTPQSTISPTDASDVLFVGSLSHRPNVQAVEFLVSDVWPRVIAAIPTARLKIVGGGLEGSMRKRWSQRPGVDVLGFVPSVLDHYATAAISVAPLLQGSGTNIKVLESYLLGRACVMTPFASRGYEAALPAGVAAAVASTPEDFAASIIAMLRDPPRRDAMAAAGQRAVIKQFSFDRFAAEVERSVRHVLATTDATGKLR